MTPRKKERSWDEIEKDLIQLRSRQRRLKGSLDDLFARRNELFREARKGGTTLAAIAKAAGANEQHVRTVIQGRNTYAAKKK